MPFMLPAAAATIGLLTALALAHATPWAALPFRESFAFWWPASLFLLAASSFLRWWQATGRAAPTLPVRFPVAFNVFAPAVAGIFLLVAFPFRLLEDPPIGAGDSLHLNEFIPVATQLFGFLTTPDELLELYVRSRLFALFDGTIASTVSLGLYSYLAAIVLLAGVTWFVRSQPAHFRILSWLILFFTPQMALFAGYVESYSMTVALTSIVILGGWMVLERTDDRARKRYLRILAAIAGIAALHHSIAGLLLPSLVVLTWFVSGNNLRVFVREALICGLIGGGIVASGYGAFALSPHASVIFADSHAGTASLVSLSGLLSGKNLAKIGPLFLLFPLPLAWAIAGGMTRIPGLLKGSGERSQRRTTPTTIFLWTATLPFLAQALAWKSSIGFPADWDLFSFFMGPLHILILHSLQTAWRNNQPTMPSTQSLSLAVAALTLLPGLVWISRLHQETPATIANRQYISSVQSRFIPALMKDDALLLLSDERRKSYSRIALFAFRVDFLREHVSLTSEEREEIKRAMDDGMKIYRSSLSAGEEEYQGSLAAAQRNFFRVFQILNGRQVHP